VNAETVGSLAAVISTLIVAVSVLVAVVNLRHVRASNELDGILALERDFRDEEMQAALRYVQSDLQERLQDAAYRAGLARRGFIDTRRHPELIVCNWCNTMGTLVKHGVVSEAMFMDLFARLIVFCWERLESVIAIMRRTRGEIQYHDFEYLALRARKWLEQHPGGTFPKGCRRHPVVDVWRDADVGAAGEPPP
jgi:hypothetical protein